jgi:hypothetical protein
MKYKPEDVRCGKTLFYARMFDFDSYCLDSVFVCERATERRKLGEAMWTMTPQEVKDIMASGFVFYTKRHASRFVTEFNNRRTKHSY